MEKKNFSSYMNRVYTRISDGNTYNPYCVWFYCSIRNKLYYKPKYITK